MKTLLLTIATLFLGAVSFAQKAESKQVTFKLKNSSILPKNITIISYQPGDAGNSTQTAMMAPLGEKKLSFKEGTRIYLADDKQVDQVMSGKRIDSEKPFLVVKNTDNNKVIPF